MVPEESLLEGASVAVIPVTDVSETLSCARVGVLGDVCYSSLKLCEKVKT